jgi:hypothetical protein
MDNAGQDLSPSPMRTPVYVPWLVTMVGAAVTLEFVRRRGQKFRFWVALRGGDEETITIVTSAPGSFTIDDS